MKYYKIYTSSQALLCYAKTELPITPEELCVQIGCPNCTATPITEQCYEEMYGLVHNNWDLKESEQVKIYF